MRHAAPLFLAAACWAARTAMAVPALELATGPLLNCQGRQISSVTVAADGAALWRAGFDSTRWSGSLKKFPVRGDDAALWDAGALLDGVGAAGMVDPDARRIFTGKLEPGRGWLAVPFMWDSLSVDQRAMLNLAPGSGKPDGLGRERLQYLRGERKLEAGRGRGAFRARDSILGDIVNSVPLVAGPPAGPARTDGQRAFQSAYRDRPHAVYVGANDGMLHAFDAAGGRELFAYVPAMLVPQLNRLTASDYLHRPYVDAAVAVGDALAGAKWKTVLAGGVGAAAQGVYALDVSDPGGFQASSALFEFSDADDAAMGYVTGKLFIAKFRARMVKGVPEYRYFAVVPGGWNSYRDDGAKRFDPSGQGALFLLALDKEATAKWQLNVNYYRFRTPVADPSLPNGLSGAAPALDADGAVRAIYAGDLQGNLWKFDFEGAAPWTGALGKQPYRPLFTALNEKGSRQAITAEPRVAYAPGGGYLVLFGTGRLLERGDVDRRRFGAQSVYAIHDLPGVTASIRRDELAPRVLRAASGAGPFEVQGDMFVYGQGKDARRGWYFDLPDSAVTGERVIAGAVLADGKLFFHTLAPDGEVCGAAVNRSYAVDALSGLSPGRLTGYAVEGIGISSPALLVTDVTVGEKGPTGRREVRRKTAAIGKEPVAPSTSPPVESTGAAGRLGWRELVNWQELRDASGKK